MKLKLNRNAFTLIELMVTIVASAILILSVVSILLLALRAWRENNIYVNLRRDAAYAISLMSRDIHEAEAGSLTPGSTGTDILSISNSIRGYVADYRVETTNNTLSYSWDGLITVPIVARNIQSFYSRESGTHDGVLLHLELSDDEFGIIITNETFVHLRN